MTGTHVMEQLGVNAEQCFMEAVCQAQVRELDLAPQLLALEQWLDKVLQDWHAPEIKSFCAQNSVLVQDLAAIQEQMQAAPTQWTAQWDELKPALNMADIFADKLMFLVFGKFNAGKSSFCNLLVDRCVAQGLPAEYFVLEAGQIQSTAGPFKEGTTETTAHIQGAVLANRLVFIDTPGLHSVTQENADLTQRFLDSADAVLWLSSSTSPGQVQELEELALEIRRRKPLMPIITRSDFLDEDIVDNQIVNVLCNKSADNRALQEADVLCRAQDKLVQLGLDADLIKSPLSVSAYAARSYGLTEQALEDAGIHRFYKAMTQMIPPLLAYKAKKPLAMYLHHLEENVSSDMVKTAQALAAYASVLQTERARLKELTEQLSESIWREVLSHILRLLDAYFAEVNVAEV
ncbi:MAG: dynamin family protein, partial [Pelistega sp.]|nr:dynamin family protein [Pelistega sp.]